MAVEGGAGGARDLARLCPEPEEAKHFAEQESRDGDEGKPEKSIELPDEEVAEELRGLLGIAEAGVGLQGLKYRIGDGGRGCSNARVHFLI